MATTINAYSVSLGLDARDYLNTASLSRTETRELTKAIESARTPAESYQRAVDKLTAAKTKGGIQSGVFNRLLDEEKRKLDAATASASNHGSSVDMLTGKIKGLVAGYIGMQTVTKSIKLAIDAEQAAAQFEVMTGSLNNSRLLIKQIHEFAAKSPVSLQGAMDSAKTMLGFGIAVQDVARNMKLLGDISGGNQQRFDSLTLAFSQMSAAGRLMGQDVLQMVNAGFNPLQQISEKTGESMLELKKRMEDGKISAEEVTNAFIDATEAGGRFHGMTEKMAETMGGKLAIAMADLDMALTKVGKSLGPLIISLTDGTKDGTSAIDGVTKAIGKMADGLGYAIALTRDLSGMTTIVGLSTDKDGEAFGNTTKYLDILEKRDMDALAEKQNKITEFEKKKEESRKKIADQESAADKEKENKRKTREANAAEVKRKSAAAKLESDKKRHEREAKSVADKLAAEEKRRHEMADRLSETALKNAADHFKKEQEKRKKIREDVGKGPQSIEAGSADAAKYMADQANAAIAARVGTREKLPTEAELLAEAKIQSIKLTAANDLQTRQVDILQKMLEKKPDLARIR